MSADLAKGKGVKRAGEVLHGQRTLGRRICWRLSAPEEQENCENWKTRQGCSRFTKGIKEERVSALNNFRAKDPMGSHTWGGKFGAKRKVWEKGRSWWRNKTLYGTDDIWSSVHQSSGEKVGIECRKCGGAICLARKGKGGGQELRAFCNGVGGDAFPCVETGKVRRVEKI